MQVWERRPNGDYAVLKQIFQFFPSKTYSVLGNELLRQQASKQVGQRFRFDRNLHSNYVSNFWKRWFLMISFPFERAGANGNRSTQMVRKSIIQTKRSQQHTSGRASRTHMVMMSNGGRSKHRLINVWKGNRSWRGAHRCSRTTPRT